MGVRNHLASNVAPLFLRLALGITFTWAGAAKMFSEAEFKGAQAASLANMGVGITPTKKGAGAPSGGNPTTPPPAEKPTMQPPATPLPPGGSGNAGPGGVFASIAQPEMQPTKAEPPATTPPVAPSAPAVTPPPAPATPQFTAEDFPEPVKLRMVYMLALGLEQASKVPPDAKNKIELWPPALASGGRPVYFAFMAGMTELVGGALVLVGFFTRVASISLAGVMLVAMWLTQIGPAVQADNTFWIFIPKYGEWSNMLPWKDMLWQFTLMMCGLALFFTGPGRASLDAVLWTVGGDGAGDRPKRAAPAA